VYYSFELYSYQKTSPSLLAKNWGSVSRDEVLIGTNEQKDAFIEKYNVNLSTKGVLGIDMENQVTDKTTDGSTISRDKNTEILYTTDKNGESTEISGVTFHRASAWFGARKSFIYMSPSGSEFFFAVALNHEFIHSYHYLILGNTDPGFDKYTENSAYTNTKMYINSYSIPVNDGYFHPAGGLNWPSDLIRIQH